MNGRKKAAIVIAVSIAIISVLTAVSINTVQAAAKAGGDDTRKSIIETFNNNTGLYDAVFAALRDAVPVGYGYVIITDGEKAGEIKVNYSDVKVETDEAVKELISDFVNITKCDAIYCDGKTLFFKTRFATAIDRMSEANIMHDLVPDTSKEHAGSRLSDEWYYEEEEIE